MKTLVTLAFASALTFGMVSCGQSDADKKKDSVQVDSIAKEANSTGDHMIDSMNAANAKMEADAHKADSIKKADSAAKAKK